MDADLSSDGYEIKYRDMLALHSDDPQKTPRVNDSDSEKTDKHNPCYIQIRKPDSPKNEQGFPIQRRMIKSLSHKLTGKPELLPLNLLL